MPYELYREKFRITEWKEGAIYKTASEGCHWFDQELVENNIPSDTQVLYVAPSTSSNVPITIRRKV